MYYAIVALDHPNSLEKRLAARPAHVARLKALLEEGRLKLAGPFPAIDSEDPGEAGFDGSMIIAEFADLGTEGRRSSSNVAVAESHTPLPNANGSSKEIPLKGGVSARLDPLRLQTVGIRGLVDELIAAFDSTVSTGKLIVSAVVSLAGALAVFLVMRLTLVAFTDGVWLAEIFGGVAS